MPRILMFDSGVGGLSILQEIQNKLPAVQVRYLMDNELFPYGIQQDEVLVERIVNLCRAHSYDCYLIVMACNTASTIVLPALREALDIPVVGVVPAIKTAAHHSQSNCIGLLATPATVDRSYTDRLIADHAKNTQVIRLGSSELVRLAEDSFLSGNTDMDQLEQILAPLNQHPTMDQLVLGCTHFPLLRDQIAELMPQVKLTDSGEAIARRSEYLLHQQGCQNLNKTNNSCHELLATCPHQDSAKLQLACQRLGNFSTLQIVSYQQALA